MTRFVFGSQCIACITLTTWLLSTQVAVSSRVVGSWDIDDEIDRDGQKDCVKLGKDKSKLLTTIPADVYLILERRDTKEEYYALAEALYYAKRGTMDAWKSSSLYRTMYIRGHEEAFKAKNVSIYLTKTDKTNGGKAVGSEIRVCFVDRVIEPDYLPPDIYHDGKVLVFTKGHVCKPMPGASKWREAIGQSMTKPPETCSELGKYKEGVYGQVYDDFPDVESDKTRLPVDLLKFLEKKDLMSENMEMAALINSGDRTGFSAAQVVAKFKAKFLAKGVKLFYAQKDFGREGLHEWHHWFEYADLDFVPSYYIPTIGQTSVEYPNRLLELHNNCIGGGSTGGSTREFALYVRDHAGQEEWGGCGDVAGAVTREKSEFPNCKCKAANEKVFCYRTNVAGRKFNIESVLSNPTEAPYCKKTRAYCSSKRCFPPNDRP